MTTLIDRIIKKIGESPREDYRPDKEKQLRQIIEAELTAVNGVDELIEEIINSIDVDGYDENGQSYSFSSTIRLELSKYIQDLKQTPVASKCTHIWYGTNAGYTDGTVVLKCRKCGIIYNNKQEDSQPKEVEKKRFLHDYSEEELEKMSEKRIDKLPQCGDAYCFDCYGDNCR